MASELRVTTIANNAGTESVDTTYVINGSAKAWFNLNAATPALRDSFNIASITDEGTGIYEGNFTSAMSNGDYSANGSSSVKGSSNSYTNIFTTGDADNTYGLHSTAAIRGTNYSENALALSDPQMMQVTVHGDLA